MASLERRLRLLEAATGTTPAVQDVAVRREVLYRMSGEDLKAYEGAVVRHEAGEKPTAADREIVARAWELNEEVAHELAQTS